MCKYKDFRLEIFDVLDTKEFKSYSIVTVKEVWCVTKSMKEFHSRYFNPRLRKMKFGDTQLEWENWWGSHSLTCAKSGCRTKTCFNLACRTQVAYSQNLSAKYIFVNSNEIFKSTKNTFV